MAETSFKDVQATFMAHIRDPENIAPLDDIEDRRLNIYRELFFNNIEGFVSSGFPVLKSLYKEDEWLSLVRAFFISHDCKSPYFLHISKEFLDYILEERAPENAEFPFIQELAHYEWIELALATAEDDVSLPIEGNVEHTPLALSSLAYSLSYHFPVHQISIDFIPTEPLDEPIYLVVYRDVGDEVQFLQINGITAVLLSFIQQQPGIRFAELVTRIDAMFEQLTKQQIEAGALTVLRQLADKRIIRQKADE
ncbi:HvfC family RiPP maturation protein [Flocculibacter collagenilyticus]|uniref:HvfC family RiPP maturation protein n=1 Tax=Flocculibacter collagenilyticus TaxID=2744479 RepID=UPI0018F5516D|nr:putative DNA-binding domain-containing protein [Flocculibacter collagenilyticus]